MPQGLFQYQKQMHIDTYAEIHVPFEKLKKILAFPTTPGSARITTESHVIGAAGMEHLTQESKLPFLNEYNYSKQFWLKRFHFNLQLGLTHHPYTIKVP